MKNDTRVGETRDIVSGPGVLFKPDRRRPIDRYIDFFGSAGPTRAATEHGELRRQGFGPSSVHDRGFFLNVRATLSRRRWRGLSPLP